ncbi:MAG: von Willebrand factor type A domain-containing protein [Bacteroidetes bacterium]|nr:von Willebrand factor type A domain-containing protein [Bacteroidota bacterium]
MKKIIPFIIVLILAQFVSCNKDFGRFENFGFTSGESYNSFSENPFVKVIDEPVSTFSIDADGGSYSNIRRFLKNGEKPPVDAIRIEEMINYFQYDFADPVDQHPIAISTEVGECPWNTEHKLIQIGIKGKTILKEDYPASNFVFLVDISGSMSSDDKLPLVKKGMHFLVDEMRDKDRMAIVTYASSPGVALHSTSDKSKIKKGIDKLGSGGSTAGGGGINKAYDIAMDHFIDGGNNRIILATDGDFNVGISDQDELIKLIEKKRESGIFLTVIGVGSGNLNEGMMEQLANNGNGTYEYMDSEIQARKVFIDEFGKFFTVAKDVKIQIDFDPTVVELYRLIGYENRVLNDSDFTNDDKDAGEIGAGQTITAIYEIKSANVNYLRGSHPIAINFRYKKPAADVSELIVKQATDDLTTFNSTSENFRFAAAITSFGLLLRDSEYKGVSDYDKVLDWVNHARTFDPNNYRQSSAALIAMARDLK